MPTLVEELYPDIDELRKLNEEFGTRKHFVEVILYELSDPDDNKSREVIDGYPITLDPQPKVSGLSTSLLAATGGPFSSEDLILSEISPQLGESDLRPDIERNQQFYYRIDGHLYVVKSIEKRLTDWKVVVGRVQE